MELDYIKNREPYSGYDEEKFITFLNIALSERCPNYSDEIHGCAIYKIRPLACRTFGYIVNPMAILKNHDCCYSKKTNPVLAEMELQITKFNLLKSDYYLEYYKQITPKTVYDYMNLAEIAAEKIGIEEAIKFYDSAEKILMNGNNSKMLLIAKSKRYETLQDPENAMKIYYDILDRNSNDIITTLKLANLEFCFKKYDDCIKHLTKALEYTQTPMIYDILGLSYIRKGECQKALDVYDAALENNFENNQSLFINKSIALQEMNRNEEAIALLQSALEKDEDDALIHVSLAFSFQKIGDYRKAQEHLQKAEILNNQ